MIESCFIRAQVGKVGMRVEDKEARAQVDKAGIQKQGSMFMISR